MRIVLAAVATMALAAPCWAQRIEVVVPPPIELAPLPAGGGNSGGPLLDERGGILGITVSGIDINGAPVGINLFIPIDDALKALALTPAS